MPITNELRARRLTGAAAIGYVVLAGVENMEALRVPLSGAGVAEIRAVYADQALATVSWVAGALSLVLYCAFVLGLVARLRAAWWTLVSGMAGPLLAALGLGAGAVLVLGHAGGATRELFELQLHTRLLAGAPMAAILVGAGLAGLRTDALPRPLCRLALVAAAPLMLGPVAAVSGSHALAVAVAVAFGGQALWIATAGLWLVAGGEGVSRLELVRRGAFLLLVVAAGAAITLAHLDVFDFGRLQAWAWVALFAGFAATTCVLALAGRRSAGAGPPAPSWVRWALGVAALALAALGVALWIDPAAVSGPFDLPPLGGRFAGSWIVMLAVLAGQGALSGRRADAQLAALALVALPGGALLAAVRTFGELDHPFAYTTALAALCSLGLGVLMRVADEKPGRRALRLRMHGRYGPDSVAT